MNRTRVSNSGGPNGDSDDAEDQSRTFVVSQPGIRRYIDIAAAILLAIATVSTAWCAYQATRWSGVQAISFAQASTNRVESTRAFNRAIQLQSIDAQLFTEWVRAYESGNIELQAFYESNLIRPQFLPYLEEWVASEPLNNPEALRNPLINESYQAELMTESDRLRELAEERFSDAADANQTGDDYILATVLFASVLFFAGISNKFERVIVQEALVGLALAMLIVAFLHAGTLPVH
jgi:hypothetical protein